jgi:CubicO group peptidase (beta-lactamase class C family)
MSKEKDTLPPVTDFKIKPLMNKLILLSAALLFLGSCSFPSKDSSDPGTDKRVDSSSQNCMGSEGSIETKAQLETEIRGQVKFLDEPDNFSTLTGKMAAYKIPAVSLAVINQGEIEWSETYGNADFPEEQNLDCSSIFQAASLSKPVTFLAALRMHSAGEIDLDENIQNYLEDFVVPQGKQTAENPVTLRNIFSHTSGINPGGYQGYARDLNMPSDLDILKGNAGSNTPAIEVVAPPNETLSYSGGGYTLAELALQDIYEDEFSSIMQKWILDPAGMEQSEFTQPLPDSKSDQVAKGHSQSGDKLDGGWRNHPEQAAAGLWSNSIDMAKFLIEIYKAYQGKSSIFSQSDIESMLSDERDGHVYGFLVNRSGDDIALTHYGGNAGYRTGMTISLSSGNGLVYLINSDNGGALGNELLLSTSAVYNWKHFKQTNASREHVSPDVLKGLTGEYKWNNQVDLSVRYDESDTLISLIFPNGDAYRLTPVVGEELDFIHPNTGVMVSFITEDDFQSFSLYGQTAVKM